MASRISSLICCCLFCFCTSLSGSDLRQDSQAPADDAQQQLIVPARGFVPPSSELPRYRVQRPASGVAPSALPDRWDCRGYGQVSPVKNQSFCGCCYAFAGVANVESKLLADGEALYDFSENNAKECAFGSPSCGGGNHYDIANHFAIKGTVLESCDPYQPFDVACETGCANVATLLGLGIISTDALPVVDYLKSYIYTFGPVYSSLYAGTGDAWYFELNDYDGSYTLYNPTTAPSNHAVLIVGWDDSLTHAGGSGAWIVKNSWGANWGGTCGYGSERGYFTIAYGSASIGTWSSYMTDWQFSDPNGLLLYYNEAGWTGQLGYGTTTAWAMSQFTPGYDVDITRVEFWTTDATSDVDIYVYDDFDGISLSNLLASVLNSTFADPGMQSVELATPLNIIGGEDIYVVTKITNISYGFPIAYDRDGPTETGKTFYSPDGSPGSWSDAGTGSPAKDLTIRVRATFSSVAPCSIAVQTPAATDVWPLDSGRTISWNSVAAGAIVRIELFKGSTLQCEIDSLAANDGSHEWQVDDGGGGAGSDYRIKISDAVDAACYAFSDYFTISIPCSFQVTGPEPGSEWLPDSAMEVLWNSSGTGPDVCISLYKGSAQICYIDTLTDNDGSYIWLVTDCGEGSGPDYQIRVADVSDTTCWASSDYFAITIPCSLEVASPGAGSEWQPDSSMSIQWNSSGASAQVRIHLFKGIAKICDIDSLTDNDGSYEWMVTDCGQGTGSDYSIKIADADDSNCQGFSSEFTITIPCEIQVQQPAGGSNWLRGSAQEILWTAAGSAANVILDLYHDLDLLCTIDSAAANDGSYSWSVDCGVEQTGSAFRIKITDAADSACYDYSDYFTITVPCEMSIIQPSTGSIWYLDSTETITWTASGAADSVAIYLCKGDSVLCAIDSLTANDGVHIWSITDCGAGPSADYYIKVEDAHDTGCVAVSSYFVIARPCEILVTSPAQFDNWVQGAPCTIEWTAAGVISNVSIDLFKDLNLQCHIDTLTANDGSYQWTAADCDGGTGSQYRIKITDTDNPLCYDFSDFFTITVLPLSTDEDESPLPNAFHLHQNFPNPFNPQTAIPIELPRSSHVNLTVYNLLGQPMRNLVSEIRGAGMHVIYWDGVDERGELVPSGIYFYRLEAGTYVEIRKMLLLK